MSLDIHWDSRMLISIGTHDCIAIRASTVSHSLLLMVQKSHSQPPEMVLKPCKSWGFQLPTSTGKNIFKPLSTMGYLPYQLVDPRFLNHQLMFFLSCKEAQELLPDAPPEAAKVLASLLATDPGVRSPSVFCSCNVETRLETGPSFTKCWMNEVRVKKNYSSKLSDTALLKTWPKQCWTLSEIFCLHSRQGWRQTTCQTPWMIVPLRFFKRNIWLDREREREVWSDWSTSVVFHPFIETHKVKSFWSFAIGCLWSAGWETHQIHQFLVVSFFWGRGNCGTIRLPATKVQRVLQALEVSCSQLMAIMTIYFRDTRNRHFRPWK